jgi:cytochrome c biogenesis factor
MVAIHSTLKEDLYVVYAGRDQESNRAVLHAYRNPLVKWIWLGGIVVVLGTVLGLLPNRQPVVVLQRATEGAAAERGAMAREPVGVQSTRTHEASD